jgi:hypothetical protein
MKGLLMLRLIPAVAVLALAATLSACGSGDPGADASDSSTNGAQTYGGPATGAQGGGPGGGQFPGAVGEIAAVQGKTLQVQNPQTGQVAVTWTAATEITQDVDAKQADVTVGSCVMVDAVTATTVRISQPVDGSCQGGFGGRGSGPSGPPSGMPSGAPPSGGSGGGPRAFGSGALGAVTAVSADGFTVDSTRPGSDDSQSVAVTVSADTTYSTSADADGSALKVGRCVQATGAADSTGAITATRIGVSDPVDGQCGGGFAVGAGPQAGPR